MPLLALTASTEGVTLSVLFNQVSPNSFAYTFKRHRSGTGRFHRLRAGGLGRGADSSGDIDRRIFGGRYEQDQQCRSSIPAEGARPRRARGRVGPIGGKPIGV